ncbi:phosphoheptose isomerase [bacterium]|nr:phosphoheptose isomerase [bacterium]
MKYKFKRAQEALNLYFTKFTQLVVPTEDVYQQLYRVAGVIARADRIFIVGNGGSSAVAGHVAEDWTKICSCPTVTFNDIALVSCFANDYGWENWIAEIIMRTGWKTSTDINYVGVFISSSGESLNILNGCKCANDIGISTITFSGFDKDNSLSKLGNINFHVHSDNYNIIETIHEAWLLSLCEIMKDEVYV